MNKTIRSSGREVIYKVYMRCLAKSEAGEILSYIGNAYERAAEMTGKSVSTVRKIVEEGQKSDGVFSTPGKHRKGRPRKDLSDFNLCAIRQKVHFFYAVKKQVPTLRNLLPVVKKDLGFDGSREHLRKILHSLGFSYKKCKTDRCALIEKPSIAAKREKYLRIIMENRNLPQELQKEIIYLNESYIHSSYKLKKCWQSVDITSVKQNIFKGKRYIIIHAGSAKGFIPNALLIFSGTNKNKDYHSEMNKDNFTKWVTEKLIPNIKEPSIIVLDDAPYHSIVVNKAPTSANNVADIKLWLTQNNIQFDDTLRKPELLMLVKQYKPDPIYEIDQILGDNDHTVVRLPPYHCDLNPIELICGIAKHKIAFFNSRFKDIKMAAEQAFASITEDDWRDSCRQVIKIEKEYYQRGAKMYDTIEQLVKFNLGDISSSSESSEYDSDVAENFNDSKFSGVEYLDETLLNSE